MPYFLCYSHFHFFSMQLSKSVMNTVLSGTHNVTLCNPLAEEEEKLPGAVPRKLLLANNKDVLLTA